MDVKQKRHVPSYGEIKSHIDESLKTEYGSSVARLDAEQVTIKETLTTIEHQMKEFNARDSVSNMAVSSLEAAIEKLTFRLDEEIAGGGKVDAVRADLDAMGAKLASLEGARSLESLEEAARTAGLFEAISSDITEIRADIARLGALKDELKTNTVFVSHAEPLVITDGDLYIFEVAPAGKVLVTLPPVAESLGREIVFKLAYDPPKDSGLCHVIVPAAGDQLEGHEEAYYTLDTLNEVAYTCCTSRGWILVNNSGF